MTRAAAEADVARGGDEEDVRLGGKTPYMTVAVIDIGSNTGRLLVARRGSPAAVVAVRNERTVLGLGHEIECTGTISRERLEGTMACARRYATLARAHGATHIDVIVTAPGRQSANAAELVAGLSHVTGVSARVLSAEEEGRYAFEGATAGVRGLELPVGVCDVGGGSTELAVGTPDRTPDDLLSIDIGSLRLTSRVLKGDPPSRRSVERAVDVVRDHLGDLDGLRVATALATGGSARALRKLVGRNLDERGLDRAVRIVARQPSDRLARTYGIHTERAHVLLAGALILRETQAVLGVPLVVARGGLREGLADLLLAERSAA
jgi:exopolyphosphatase / guanosine-5'-triphosphate,3'-diphosphate pyrophosphatase